MRNRFGNKKSKFQWALHGDKNTKVFLAAVQDGRACNGLNQLQDVNGVLH